MPSANDDPSEGAVPALDTGVPPIGLEIDMKRVIVLLEEIRSLLKRIETSVYRG